MDLILREGALPVIWDINKCPVTNEGEARRVRSWIYRFVRKEGYPGPIAITAVGLLSKVPVDILEAVSSTGITLYDVPYGRKNIVSLICFHYSRNPPPVKVILIAPPQSYPPLWDDFFFIFPMNAACNKANARIFWPTSLADFKCRVCKGCWDCTCIGCSMGGAVESVIWVCGVCNKLAGRGFENFKRHRFSPEHTHKLFLDEQDNKAEEDLKRLRREEDLKDVKREEEKKDVYMARRVVLL